MARRHPLFRLLSGALALGVVGLAVAPGSLAQETSTPAGTATEGDHQFAAPVDFVVIDARASLAQAAAAGEKLPIVVRTAPEATDAVVTEFDVTFRATREAFLDALRAEFGHRVLDSDEIDSSRFRSRRSEFQADHPSFPVNLALAQAWASGDEAEAVRARLAASLRAAMSGRLIANLRPASTVFVTTLSADDRVRTWGEVTARARALDPADIASVETAGQDLRQSLDVLDRWASGFLAGLLRPNVVEDDYLTGLLLRERFTEKALMRGFRRGELLVDSGMPDDRFAELAVEQLSRMGLEPLLAGRDTPLSPPPVTTPAPIAAPPAQAPPPAAQTERGWLVAVGIGGGAVLLLAGVLLWRRARRQRRLANIPNTWVDRPTAAPQNVREALIPHLARELKHRLVQALFAQRQELLHNEAAATARVAELEARLAKVQPAIAAKIRGYEQRIRALEAELEEKDQETRDLIRAKLVLARKELDAEITRQHIKWN